MGRQKYIPAIELLFIVATLLLSCLFLGRRDGGAGLHSEPNHRLVVTVGEMDRSIFMAGDSLRRELRFREAIEAYRPLLDLQGIPSTLRMEAEYDIGLSLLRLGEYDEAENIFTRMLAESPEDPKAGGYIRYCLAWMAQQQGKTSLAATMLHNISDDRISGETELSARMRMLSRRISRGWSFPGGSASPSPDSLYSPDKDPDAALTVDGAVWDLPVDILIREIYFSHGGERGSLDIRVDYGTDILVPEYRDYPFRSEPFAFSAGNPPEILVKLRAFPPAPPSVVIDAITVAGGAMWKLRSRVVRFTGNGFSVGDSDAPPNCVRFRTESEDAISRAAGCWLQVWNWRVTAVGGKSCAPFSIGDTVHRYYTVLAPPVKPMTEPWTTVLDRSCGWAGGGADPAECLRALTERLYSCGAQWDTAREYTREGGLDLERLLRDMEDPPPNFRLNCSDYSQFFAVLAASLGIPCSCRDILPVFPASSFRTRQVLPSGWPDIYDNWRFLDFGVHRVCEWNGKIIDPSFRLHTYPSSPPDPVVETRLSCGTDRYSGPFPESYQALFLEHPETAYLGNPEPVEILDSRKSTPLIEPEKSSP